MPDQPRTAQTVFDQSILEMRWRCLSLAADLDRIDRMAENAAVNADPRMAKLRRAISVLLEGKANRAEQVQMIFSDTSSRPR
jgi:hypothetical protein